MRSDPRLRGAPVTARQLRVLRLIVIYGDAHDRLPTTREIAEALGISRQAADGHIRELVAKGQLAPRRGRHRNIVPTAAGQSVLRCSSSGCGHEVGSGCVYGGVS